MQTVKTDKANNNKWKEYLCSASCGRTQCTQAQAQAHQDDTTNWLLHLSWCRSRCGDGRDDCDHVENNTSYIRHTYVCVRIELGWGSATKAGLWSIAHRLPSENIQRNFTSTGSDSSLSSTWATVYVRVSVVTRSPHQVIRRCSIKQFLVHVWHCDATRCREINYHEWE